MILTTSMNLFWAVLPPKKISTCSFQSLRTDAKQNLLGKPVVLYNSTSSRLRTNLGKLFVDHFFTLMSVTAMS